MSMKLLIPESDLKLYKSRDKSIPLECYGCGKTFFATKNEIQTSRSDKNRNRLKYCSLKCKGHHTQTRKSLTCFQCGKSISVIASDVRDRNFCSKSCAAIYHNTNKTTGTNRSKLEVWMERQLTDRYASVEFLWNNRTVLD